MKITINIPDDSVLFYGKYARVVNDEVVYGEGYAIPGKKAREGKALQLDKKYEYPGNEEAAKKWLNEKYGAARAVTAIVPFFEIEE